MVGGEPVAEAAHQAGARQLSMVNIIYRLYILYQPGGASERQQILNALLDTKTGNASEVAKQLWRHWRKRALELGVALPDATLVSALDKFAAALSKLDQQSSYRMSTVRRADSGSGGELRGVPPGGVGNGGVGKGRQGGWCRKGGGWTLEAIEWWWDSRKPRVVDLSRACKWYATRWL